MIKYILPMFAALLCGLLAAPVAAVDLRDEVWVANGPVHSSVASNDLTVLFLGADAGATITQDGFPRVNGPVHAVISDGAGGSFIGGEFTEVGGQPRDSLAHIDAFNRLTAWAPAVDGAVYALALNGDALYVGGDFTRIAGAARERLAVINAATGAVDQTWVPAPNGPVYALLVDDTALYAGGDFTQIAGVNRGRLAALDLEDATASAWNPAADAAVRALVLSAGLLYAGGDFTHIGGVSRNRLAALSVASALASSWNPDADATVRALTSNAGLLYAGGDFTHIGGASRNRIAAINSGSGAANAWNPDADAAVRALAISGNSLYAGGDFTEIGGLARNRIAKFNIAITSGITDPIWDAGADETAAGGVEALMLSGETLYAGGTFDTLNGVTRRNTILYLGGEFDYVGPVTGAGAALDAAGTGAADFDFPRVNGPVHSVIADGSGGWFIGGEFTRVGEQARGNLAHIDAAKAVTAWAPAANGTVRTLALEGGALYVGGEFTQINGANRNRIAAIDAASGVVAAWNPASNGTVLALLPAGATVYAGGEFTQIGAASRNHLAALNVSSGIASTWNPDADDAVRALVLNGMTLYAGGDFATIDGGSRAYLAALDTTQMTAGLIDTDWNPAPDGAVRVLVLNGTMLYAGGDFSTIDGGSRAYLAALNTAQTTAGSIDTDWNPAPNGAVRSLLLSGTTLYAGGEFTAMGGLARNRLAVLDTTVSSAITDTAWNPGASGAVDALALNGGMLYAGGEFTSVNGVTRRNIAALDPVTGAATAWDPDANGAVRTLWLGGSVLYLGGDFTSIAGQTRNRLAGLNTTTGAATTWNPGANGRVYALALANGGGSFYVGGTFTTLGGLARNWLGEIALANGAATGWNPVPADGTGVYALAVNGATLYVAGDFESIDGEGRDRIAAFDMRVPELINWAPQIDDGSVRTLTFIADSNVLYAGGDFTAVAGHSQTGLAAWNPANKAPLVWNPQLNGAVRALIRSFDRTRLYVGGDFTAVAGAMRNHIAALAVSNGVVDTGWNVDIDAPVSTLTAVNDTAADAYTLYTGGSFATVDGATRQSLAALAALPPEQTAPVTTATPAGGLHNSTTAVPIVLACNDNGGSGCAATYYTVDGSEPTTASQVYSDEIPLTADLLLKFFSIDNAGNAGAVQTEIYSIELGAPLTTASPATRVFSSNSIEVTLSCSDGAGTGCAATYYTLDGSQPNTGSMLYTGPIVITDTTVLKFFSVDAVGNAEGIKREEYAHTRGKVGAFGLFELLAIALGVLLRAGRRAVHHAAR